MVRRLLSLPPIFSLFPTAVWLPLPRLAPSSGPVPLHQAERLQDFLGQTLSRFKALKRPQDVFVCFAFTRRRSQDSSRLKSTFHDTGAPVDVLKDPTSKSPFVQDQARLTLHSPYALSRRTTSSLLSPLWNVMYRPQRPLSTSFYAVGICPWGVDVKPVPNAFFSRTTTRAMVDTNPQSTSSISHISLATWTTRLIVICIDNHW
ncbi:hypothetical protein DFH06DRAFT_1477278 [Mycena polygramma]|nr:hypothetical protein DFH06DRAFT_1477278 [Mycena polygramma]